MKFSIAFAAAALLPASLANPLEKRAATYAITGVHVNGTQPRLEIRTLQQIPDQWNLYLLATANFKNMTQSLKLSYYQVAGIHGVPNIAWDGVTANPAAIREGAVGYCTHAMNLFPTWHRAYMALFEQTFYAVVNSTVKSFPAGAQRKRWQAAANNLRVPYWDWAMTPPSGQNNLPSCITDPTVNLITPAGNVTVENPLLQYRFHPLNGPQFYYDPWDFWNTSLRWPTTEYSNATSQEVGAIATTQNNRLSYQQRIYNIFTAFSNFTEFSNEGWESSSTLSNKDSLESVHDAIHGDIGGDNNGHMAILWYAAFDPIFWLHHANVDRMIALWQAIYPTSWVETLEANSFSFTITNHTILGATSPLTPFHSDTVGTFHTSNSVQNWTTFGYTYPEFLQTDGSSAAIKQVVYNLYGGSSSKAAVTHPKKREAPADAPAVTVPLGLTTNADGLQYQYIANIVAERFGLESTFTVYVFFGTPPTSPKQWPTAVNMIGSHSFFSMPSMGGMSMQMKDPRSSGTVPLTHALLSQVANGQLASMNNTEVVPFLQNTLHWRIACNGKRVHAADVPALEVSVVSALTTIPATTYEFPVWSDYQTLASITRGKAGGVPQ